MIDTFNVSLCFARWHDAGVEEIIVKQNDEPCLVSTAKKNICVAANKVKNIIDTSAAGDSFNTAYLATCINGLESEMTE